MKTLNIIIAIIISSLFIISCSKDDATTPEPYKSAAVQFENTTPTAIADATPDIPALTISTINVLTTGTVKDYKKITLEMNVSHTFQTDLEFILVAPDNSERSFVYRAGSNKKYISTNKLRFNALFTNTLPTASMGVDIPAGDYKETNCTYTTPLFVMDTLFTFLQEKNVNGIWKLKIKDYSEGDSGTLHSWRLLFAEDALN